MDYGLYGVPIKTVQTTSNISEYIILKTVPAVDC